MRWCRHLCGDISDHPKDGQHRDQCDQADKGKSERLFLLFADTRGVHEMTCSLPDLPPRAGGGSADVNDER